MTTGKELALAHLSNDEDMGAGNPAIIREAAKIARDNGDEEFARELEDDALGWERYLSELAAQMRPMLALVVPVSLN